MQKDNRTNNSNPITIKGGVVMKKKNVLTLVVAFVLAVSFIVPIVMADDHGKGMGPGPGHHGKKGNLQEKLMMKAHFLLKNKEELGLTDEQVAKIKALKINTKKALIKQKADIEIIAIDIKAALFEDTIDKVAVGKLIDQKYEIKKTSAKTLVNAMADLKTVLTDEQKEKCKELFKAKMEEWKSKKHCEKGEHKGGPMGDKK
jgi:Spy/CpxP family protein refolding chaperone